MNRKLHNDSNNYNDALTPYNFTCNAPEVTISYRLKLWKKSFAFYLALKSLFKYLF